VPSVFALQTSGFATRRAGSGDDGGQPRVDAFMTHYRTLSDDAQQMVRDMVELAWLSHRQQFAERLAASAPFKMATDRTWAARRPSFAYGSTYRSRN
jgi:hypothetical protein